MIVVTFEQQSSKFKHSVSDISKTERIAPDGLRCTSVSQSGGWRVLPMRWVRTNRRWSTWLALAAMALQLVLSCGHIHLESAKRLRHRQRGGIQSALVPAKPDSASGERGGRFLRDLRDHPSRLDFVSAGCAAAAGAVRVANGRAFRTLCSSFLSRRNVRHFNRALLRSPDLRSLLI